MSAFYRAIAWVLFVIGTGMHLLRPTTDGEAAYCIAQACFFMLLALWERKP